VREEALFNSWQNHLAIAYLNEKNGAIASLEANYFYGLTNVVERELNNHNVE
jgi:hypothetical protein